MNIADMAILTFNAESALLRVIEKMTEKNGAAATTIQTDMMHCYLNDAVVQSE